MRQRWLVAVLMAIIVMIGGMVYAQNNITGGVITTSGTTCITPPAASPNCIQLQSLNTSNGVIAITMNAAITPVVQIEGFIDTATGWFPLPVFPIGNPTGTATGGATTVVVNSGQFVITRPVAAIRVRASTLLGGTISASILVTTAPPGSPTIMLTSAAMLPLPDDLPVMVALIE